MKFTLTLIVEIEAQDAADAITKTIRITDAVAAMPEVTKVEPKEGKPNAA